VSRGSHCFKRPVAVASACTCSGFAQDVGTVEDADYFIPVRQEYPAVYFAVPEHRFGAFTQQSIQMKKGVPVHRHDALTVARVQQSALKVVC
jgi:hypothetical protein